MCQRGSQSQRERKARGGDGGNMKFVLKKNDYTKVSSPSQLVHHYTFYVLFRRGVKERKIGARKCARSSIYCI